MHCFSGTAEHARRSLDSASPLVCRQPDLPRGAAIREAAAQLPADRILVETDAPFLAPIPHRGQRNEPALVVHTAARPGRASRHLRGRSWPRRPRRTSSASFRSYGAAY